MIKTTLKISEAQNTNFTNATILFSRDKLLSAVIVQTKFNALSIELVPTPEYYKQVGLYLSDKAMLKLRNEALALDCNISELLRHYITLTTAKAKKFNESI